MHFPNYIHPPKHMHEPLLYTVTVIFLKNTFENIHYEFDENEGINVLLGFFLGGGGEGG